MTINRFLELMEFPPLWRELDVVDADYVTACIALYRPGHECAPEHFCPSTIVMVSFSSG